MEYLFFKEHEAAWDPELGREGILAPDSVLQLQRVPKTLPAFLQEAKPPRVVAGANVSFQIRSRTHAAGQKQSSVSVGFRVARAKEPDVPIVICAART